MRISQQSKVNSRALVPAVSSRNVRGRHRTIIAPHASSRREVLLQTISAPLIAGGVMNGLVSLPAMAEGEPRSAKQHVLPPILSPFILSQPTTHTLAHIQSPLPLCTPIPWRSSASQSQLDGTSVRVSRREMRRSPSWALAETAVCWYALPLHTYTITTSSSSTNKPLFPPTTSAHYSHEKSGMVR